MSVIRIRTVNLMFHNFQISEENEFFCVICKTLQKIPESQNKRERKDLNSLLNLCVKKLREKMPGPLLARDPPQVSVNPGLASLLIKCAIRIQK